MISVAPSMLDRRLTALCLASLHLGTSTLLCTSLFLGVNAQVQQQSAFGQTLPTLPPPPNPDRPSPQTNPVVPVPSRPLPSPQQRPTQTLPNPVEDFDTSPDEKFRLYRLGPGDQIFVQVQRFPDLNFNGAISPEGKIIMPLIGTVFLQGLTLEQAQEEIRRRLNQFFVEPVVSVELLVQRPVAVTISGEVARPGFYSLPSNLSRISDALQAAGGATPASDLRLVLVRRTIGDRSVIEQRLDLVTPLKTGGPFPSLRLADGDVVIVPRQEIDRALDYSSDTAANSALASQTPVKVTVAGEVARPGFYLLSPLTSGVSDALLAAGGVTAASDLAAVRVRRILGDRQAIEQSLNLLTSLRGGSLPSLRLADGDVIIVPKRAIAKASDDESALVASSTLASTAPVQVTITGEVARPGPYPLPPSSRVSDALLTAGGITQNADLRAVRVRRALGDGRFSEETLDLFTPLQTSQALPDLRLATGDAIVVSTLEAGQDRGYNRQLVSRSTLAKPTIAIRILSYAGGGAGTLTLPNGSTFADALGGIPLDTADLRKIALIRFDPEQGKAVTLHLDGKEALKGDPSQNPLLQENDAIVIGRNLVARISYALNTFTQPFRDVLGFLLFFSSLQNSASDLFGPGR